MCASAMKVQNLSTGLGLSIVIPTRNRYPALVEALKSIKAQTIQPQEVIVVDQTPRKDGQPESLLKILSPQVHLDYLWNPAISGLTQARNAAIERAHGDILLFLDDDVTLHRDFTEKLLASWSVHPEAVGISGVPDNYSRPPSFYYLWSKVFMLGPFHDDRQPVYWRAKNLIDLVQVTRFSGGMMSLRKSTLHGLRFDESLRGVADGEDVDFCVRLKGIFYMNPRCQLTHHFNSSQREKTHWTQRHARANTYLYQRNWSQHKIAYAWLRAGYFVAALLGCVSRRSIDPMCAMLAGCSEGKQAAARPGKETAFSTARVG